MEGILTEITNPRIVLETLAKQKIYLSVKPTDKEATIKKDVNIAKPLVEKKITMITVTRRERDLLTG